MTTCASCGHELGGGRFCTQCGAPAASGDATQQMPAVAAPVPATETGDGWRTDTAERPAVSEPTHPVGTPTPRPAAGAPVNGGPVDSARYPLFADQVEPTVQVPAGPPPAPEPVLAPEPPNPGTSYVDRRRWVPWVAGAVALLLVVVLGAWLLGGGDDSAPEAAGGHGAQGHGSGAGGPDDVARAATAQVPATAPPNQDLDGNMVRYDARNMLDGVPSTCWRMAGDGTGAEITFRLPGPTRLTTVGLINGYAKSATDARGHRLDWYHGNRRVLGVEWTFDDGTTVTQDLADTPRMQTTKIDPVTTRTVRLRLVSVSPPGRGPAARDYTPISDVALVGAPG